MILLLILICVFIIFIKFKPKYTVKFNGQEIGDITDKERIEKNLNEKIENPKAPLIKAEIDSKPEFELKLVAKDLNSEEDQKVENIIDSNIKKTYRLYEIKVENEVISKVNDIDQANNIVEEIKKDRDFKDIESSELITDVLDSDKMDDAKEKVINKVIEVQNKRKEEAERKRKEAERLRQLYSASRSQYIAKSLSPNAREALSRMTFIVPSNRALITCVFGGYAGHRGTDLAATVGAPVKASSPGRVVTIGNQPSGYGKYVEIDHGNGISTLYAHCSDTSVVYIGQDVAQGEMIARAGMTGRTTGPHVHFEIRVNGVPIPAERYINAAYL